MDKYILALDCSTKSTGYAIYNNQQLVDYGCIVATDSNVFNRIDKMVEGIENIIHKYNFTQIYIEDVYPEDVHNNQNVFNTLKYLQGFILHLLNKYNLNHIFFTASEWRSKCGIQTGRGIKRDVLKNKDIKFVQNQFNITVNDDIADAICIGYAAVGGSPIQSEVIKTEDGFEFG